MSGNMARLSAFRKAGVVIKMASHTLWHICEIGAINEEAWEDKLVKRMTSSIHIEYEAGHETEDKIGEIDRHR